MIRNSYEQVRAGVWVLVPHDPVPFAPVLIDGWPPDDYWDRPDVVAYYEEAS